MKRKIMMMVFGLFVFSFAFTVTNYAYNLEFGCGQECSAQDANGCAFDKCNYVTSGGQTYVACYYKACKGGGGAEPEMPLEN